MPLIPLFLEVEEPLPDIPDPTDPATVTHADRYDLVIETMAGVRLAPLPSAVLDELTDPLNQSNVATVKVSCWDPNIGALLNADGEPWLLKRYLAVVMNGHPIHRGPIVSAPVDADGLMTLTSPDPSWWLQHRVIGRATRDNMLDDGLFDSTGTGWDAANCAPTWDPVDVTIPGSYTAVLTPPVDYGPGAYIERVVTYEPTTFTAGLTYVALGWLKTSPDVAFKGRVMEVVRYANETDRLADKAADRQTFSFDDLPEPDAQGWRPIPVPFHVPASATAFAQDVVRFFAPTEGWARWGSGFEQVRDDTFASEEFGTNLATLAKWLIQWVQDPEKGNTDLNLTTNCPATATVDTLSVPEHELRTADDILRTELVDVAGGVDWRIEYGRRATTFRTGWPRFDALRTDMPLRAGRFWRSVSWDLDASDVDTDTIAKGDDDGFWAQAGSYVDRSALDDDLNTVGVYQAPSGTPYGKLPRMAERRGQVRSDVARKPAGSLPASFWLWTSTGEQYRSQHHMGEVYLKGTHRSQTRTLRPSDGIVEVELAPVSTGKELADDVVALHDRVAELAARPQPTLRGWAVAAATFSQTGPVQAITGGYYQHPVPARLVQILAALKTPASDDVVGHLNLDGVPGPEFTIPAGETTHTTWVESVGLGTPGVISATVDSGGTDGSGLVVQGILRELPR